MNCLKQADGCPKYTQINKTALAQPKTWSLGIVTNRLRRTRDKWQEQTQGTAEQGLGEPWDATDATRFTTGAGVW